MNINIVMSGALAEGRALGIVDDYLDAAKDEVASQGYANVMGNLNASIREPTPYYETQVTVDRTASDRVVHDRGVIYGPWLEGVGSRNYPVTSFKGYHAFRRATAELEKQAPRLCERVLPPYLNRMG